MNRRDEILERIQGVPSLPVAAVQAMHLLDKADADVSELNRLIETDPGLTSNILRLANSAFFGGRSPTSTVRDAIVRLGTRRVVYLVLASSTAPLTDQPVRGYDLPSHALLIHSLAVAVGAERTAIALKQTVPDHMFTAGLLHDIGKIVLGTFLEVDAAPILRLAFEEKLSFEKAEREVLGLDHAEVGAALLKGWRLPEAIVEVVRWHHEPETCPESEQPVNDYVHVADNISRQAGMGSGLDGMNYESSASVLGRLGVTTQITEAVTCAVYGYLKELQPILGFDEGGSTRGD